jgi:hypothetical protein
VELAGSAVDGVGSAVEAVEVAEVRDNILRLHVCIKKLVGDVLLLVGKLAVGRVSLRVVGSSMVILRHIALPRPTSGCC